MAGRSAVPARLEELLRRPIEEVAELSVRSVNSLKKENIQTVRDLVERTEEQMLTIDNFGRKSLQEIGDFLAAQGLRFGIEVQEENGTLYWDAGQLEGSDGSGSSNDNE
jgi:DNA-directed RNA polymerase subunit alpha